MVCHKSILCIWACMVLLHKIICILVLWVTSVDQFFFCFQNYSPYITFTLSLLFIFCILSHGSVATPPSPASLSAEWSLCNMFSFEDFRWTLYCPIISYPKSDQLYFQHYINILHCRILHCIIQGFAFISYYFKITLLDIDYIFQPENIIVKF